MHRMTTQIFLTGFVALCSIGLIASSSDAQITVDNVIVHIGARDRPVHNVVVRNNSNNIAYVVVEVERVPDPGKDIGKSEPTSELLASPKSFSIEPNGQRTVRLLLKSPPEDKEKLYRVAFVPQDRGFGNDIVRDVAGRKANLRVLTGMGMLVFADPKNPQSDLQWTREGDKIHFKNNGNVHVYLGDGQSCTKDNVCTKVDSRRIYGGTEFEITTPSSNTVTYSRREATLNEQQKLTIPPK